MIVLTTSRLRVRDWTADDATALSQLTVDDDVVRFLAGRPWSPTDARAMIDTWREIADGLGVATWAIEALDGTLVGYCGFARTNADWLRSDTVEIGWLLGRRYWGRGLATEAARAVLALGLRHIEARRIASKCHIANHASERVMQRLGMRKVGVVRRTTDLTVVYRLP